MQHRRHGDEMTWKEARHYLPHALIVLVLWTFAMTKDYNAELTTEQMTREQVEAIARNYATTLVGCANGHSISVGDMLIKCEPFAVPVMEFK